MTRKIAELAFDIHTGMSSLIIPEFDELRTIGMAATLSVNLRGLGQIEYEVLRMVSDHFMAIPSIALPRVIDVLEEIEFVRTIRIGRRITSVIPNIPIFDDIYQGIGDYASTSCHLNSHEQAILAILENLESAPKNKDSLQHSLGLDNTLFKRSIALSTKSGIVSEHQARGRSILISPYYFADNLSGLADAAAKAGSNSIVSALNKLKHNQGWPLSLLDATGEIGGYKLDPTERGIVEQLAQEGVIKPPTIKFGNSTQSFLFTPRPGGARLNASNREVYERSMALVSAVRKGQLLPNEYRIRDPLRLLEAFRERGYLRANSEAREQYRNLVVLRVALLEHAGGDWWRLRLNNTPENRAALDLAINLVRTGTLANMEVNEEARIALSKDEEYVQSLIAASELKARLRPSVSAEATHQFEQLLLGL